MNHFAYYRRKAKLLQDDIAKKLCIDRSTVAKWETGVAVPRVDTLLALAKLYGCSVGALLGVEEDSKDGKAV